MPADSGSPRDFRENTRAPLNAPATLQVDAFSEPLAGYTGDISLGGMFVKMRNPPPVGTLLRFEIELEEPAGTVKGMGEVAWLRAHGLELNRPAGMGMRFRFVEEDGEPLLRQAIEEALKNLPLEAPGDSQPKAATRSRPQARPHSGASASSTPARNLHRKPISKRSTPSRTKSTTASRKRADQDDNKRVLGLPIETAKVILLVTLFLVMILLFMRGLG